jgi:hypothetical protein
MYPLHEQMQKVMQTQEFSPCTASQQTSSNLSHILAAITAIAIPRSLQANQASKQASKQQTDQPEQLLSTATTFLQAHSLAGVAACCIDTSIAPVACHFTSSS